MIKHNTTYVVLLFLSFSVAIISCQKIESNNPFDSNCPKASFTPSSLNVSQGTSGIDLNWSFISKNISGYKLKRSIDNGPQGVIAILPRECTNYCDTIILLGARYKYSVSAYAGNNESNSTDAFFSPEVLVETKPAQQITTNSASLGGVINVALGTNNIISRGVSYRVANSNTTTGTGTQGGDGSFNINVTNLLPNTTYFFKAIAVNNQNKTFFGKEISFTTNSLSLATLNTLTPSSVTSSFATLGSEITYDGGSTITENGIVYSTNPNPTVSDTRVINTSGNNTFSTIITGLSPTTTYYVKGYAINGQGVSYGNQVNFTTSIRTVNTGNVTDIDGNSYRTVTIGNQVWMAENLKTTRYNNGSLISNISDSLIWGSFSNGAYCWYNNSISNKPTYGGLYNFYSVNNGNVCPIGWHIPSEAEWDELITFLGGTNIAGGKMKEMGNAHWISPNNGATNSSGFTALPNGGRRTGGINGNYVFQWLTNSGTWWSSTAIASSNPNYLPVWYYTITNSSTSVYKQYSMKNDGNAIRCVGN